MGGHSNWRKLAKRERRRRIRQELARERDHIHESWLKEDEAMELLEREQIEKSNMEENEKWMRAEKVALEQWQIVIEKRKRLQEKYLENETKLKLEWEAEQKRKMEEEERLKQIEEENKKKQEQFMEKLNQFLFGDSPDPPEELLVYRETRPNTGYCPFFSKTACCRFGDACSRNHQYPGISKVLLALNFYSHFGLDNANFNEYDTDVMLEYEDSETYQDFNDFFYDVVPEFEKFGKIIQFKVCNNHEKHLRGNTFIEYEELRSAVAAYKALHARWYGGRQITLQFSTIPSWKNAICGLQSRKQCPKGRACNFLHVFRNPNNKYATHRDVVRKEERKRSPRRWRWSESPEVESPRRKISRDRQARHRERRRRRRSRSQSRSESRDSRSRRKSSTTRKDMS